MEQAEIVNKHADLKKRAEAVGITLLSIGRSFIFNDVPGSQGRISFANLSEVELFIYGYEYAYRVSLKGSD